MDATRGAPGQGCPCAPTRAQAAVVQGFVVLWREKRGSGEGASVKPPRQGEQQAGSRLDSRSPAARNTSLRHEFDDDQKDRRVLRRGDIQSSTNAWADSFRHYQITTDEAATALLHVILEGQAPQTPRFDATERRTPNARAPALGSARKGILPNAPLASSMTRDPARRSAFSAVPKGVSGASLRESQPGSEMRCTNEDGNQRPLF